MISLKNVRSSRIAHLGAVALLAALGGCAAQAPSLAYQGPAQKGALAGKVVCAQVSMPGVDFRQFVVTKDHPQHNGDYVMQPQELAGVYGDEIVSAVKAEGATITPDPAKADILIETVMHPSAGHTHLVWTQYRLGKTAAVAMIPLTHTRYYAQHDQIDETITITEKGSAQPAKTLHVALTKVTPFEANSLKGGSEVMRDMAVYRDLQAQAVKKVLAALG